jgi:hypothetical protein
MNRAGIHVRTTASGHDIKVSRLDFQSGKRFPSKRQINSPAYRSIIASWQEAFSPPEARDKPMRSFQELDISQWASSNG